MNDVLEKFEKHPSMGISPSSLLKDTLKYFRCKSFSKDLEMTPERLFLHKSKDSKLIKPPNDSGIDHIAYYLINLM